ncbi:2-C-methyl-D-erythritol 4-phosphate cytidylyltransferase [Sediminicurvatus halobius]|uniref:2-C-methyl-D-erythritol 4-phosphate cytidylyltransferase n=1 Tax=Sediminicurvatus halobius TaxID=2182432 RepID=A0A2U2N4E2_9GAMM|nr:2-C-methyl-D-erythritol 4-phosphate cytidylyltransferase [Spiribacter halobius]PWG63927.1 2-C-methyl-D-erythritol 4-phosphate cytidylyltransferase [Spiribacter halobius]UEX76340.1 2-C-methyl-D-erythritol 4-phosphate cytidylyltransferase [Spiribacter halobius]
MRARALWAVVAAAGGGERFGSDLPKQYQVLHGRSVLGWSLQAVRGAAPLQGLALVLAPGDEHWRALDEPALAGVIACRGGTTRQASVANGLAALGEAGAGTDDLVLVHDAARPCVRTADIRRLIERAGDSPDGGLLAAPVRDTLKRAAGEQVQATVPRGGLWQAFTPQLFPFDRLRRALAAAAEQPVTDEAEAMERAGARPRLVEGAVDNIKLTYASDLALAAAILAAREAGAEEAP